MLICFIDNDTAFHAIDYLLHDYIDIYLVQNGLRFPFRKYNKPGFEHMNIKPIFASNFLYLNPNQLEILKSTKSTILNSYAFGSLQEKQRSSENEIQNDICVIANSINTRRSNVKLAEYLKAYSEIRDVRIVVASKKSEQSVGYSEYIRLLKSNYGPFAEIVPRVRGKSSINLALQSRLAIGFMSTLILELLSYNHKVINFNLDYEEINNAFPSPLNFSSSSFTEFVDYVDSLLSLPIDKYICMIEPYLDVYSIPLLHDTTTSNHLSDAILHIKSEWLACNMVQS